MERSEAIKKIEDILSEATESENAVCYVTFEDAEALDMAIIALEQEPKTGYWIDDEFGSKCSCCGIYTHLDKFDRPMKFKHCSMCGAKMVEPQESEDKECI